MNSQVKIITGFSVILASMYYFYKRRSNKNDLVCDEKPISRDSDGKKLDKKRNDTDLSKQDEFLTDHSSICSTSNLELGTGDANNLVKVDVCKSKNIENNANNVNTNNENNLTSEKLYVIDSGNEQKIKSEDVSDCNVKPFENTLNEFDRKEISEKNHINTSLDETVESSHYEFENSRESRKLESSDICNTISNLEADIINIKSNEVNYEEQQNKMDGEKSVDVKNENLSDQSETSVCDQTDQSQSNQVIVKCADDIKVGDVEEVKEVVEEVVDKKTMLGIYTKPNNYVNEFIIETRESIDDDDVKRNSDIDENESSPTYYQINLNSEDHHHHECSNYDKNENLLLEYNINSNDDKENDEADEIDNLDDTDRYKELEFTEDDIKTDDKDDSIIKNDDNTVVLSDNEIIEDIVMNGNWHEDSLNKLKNYYHNDITSPSPQPSNESEKAFSMNNLTREVARTSAEYIFESKPESIEEFEIVPYKIGDKMVNVALIPSKQYIEFGLDSAVIERIIPVGYAGRVLGKKGKIKKQLRVDFGATIRVENTNNQQEQLVKIYCSKDKEDKVRNWLDDHILKIENNKVNTPVSYPNMLKMKLSLGKLVPIQVVDYNSQGNIFTIKLYEKKAREKFNKMQQELNSEYSSKQYVDHDMILPSPISVNCICVAMIAPNSFVRALIIGVYDDIAIIYLLDEGTALEISMEYLFKIKMKFMLVPYQIIITSLAFLKFTEKPPLVNDLIQRIFFDSKKNRPRAIYGFFSRIDDCCIPSVHFYISKDACSDLLTAEQCGASDFVDFNELVCALKWGFLEKTTIDVKKQENINSYYMASLGHTDYCPAFFKPPNYYLYEDKVNFVDGVVDSNDTVV